MPDEVRSGLPTGIVTILWVLTACASHCAVYSSANNTNGEIHDDKEKDEQYNRSSNAF